MKKSKFEKEFCKGFSHGIVDKNDLSYVEKENISEERRVKQWVSDNIDFKCDFKDGVCKTRSGAHTNNFTVYSMEVTMCCCGDCRIRFGYLDLILKEDVAMYARHFNEKTGFWRKGKGCILKPSMRSRTCIFYSCLKDNDTTAVVLNVLRNNFNNKELITKKRLADNESS
jgi:hypothetical protein